jgi:hypothetical protein
LQKTKEKLKNPQQPDTQAPESQEGLKHEADGARRHAHRPPHPESQEGLKLYQLSHLLGGKPTYS